MRGSPPLHLVLFALAFALLAVPLGQLTFGRLDASQTERVADPLAPTPAVLRVRFAHVPKGISVKLGAKELMPAKPQATASMEARVELAIPKEGIDLLVGVTWPEGTPDTAVTVELEPDGLEAQAQTRWSTGAKLTEVFTFQWMQP